MPVPTVHRTLRTLLVQRDELFRRGLADLLEDAGAATVVAQVATVADAAEAAVAAAPDVALVDELLPDGDGLQLVRQLRARDPPVACVLVAEALDDRTRLAALLHGAAAVDRDADERILVAAFAEAADGRALRCPERVGELLDALHARAATALGDPTRGLTPQERRVFELVGLGLTNAEVGELLRLTEKTVKNYVSRVLARLGLRHRTQVAMLAARLAVTRGRA